MTRKRKSASSSGPLKKKASTRRRSQLGDDIIRGLEEGLAHVRGERKLQVRVVQVPEEIDVRAIREKAGLSQSEFAARYGFNLRTLQEWEQGRTRPDNAIRAYLTVIDRNPRAVDAALAS